MPKSSGSNVSTRSSPWAAAKGAQVTEKAASPRKYWPVNENNVHVRVFNEILNELDHSFFNENHIESFKALSVESRFIITRLYLRQHKWVPIGKLEAYLPRDQLETALKELVASSWLQDDASLDNQLDTANLDELKAACNVVGIKARGTRPELVAELQKAAKRNSFFGTAPLMKKIQTALLRAGVQLYLLSPYHTETLSQMVFMFCLPANIGVETIVLTNMRIQKYLDYQYCTQKEMPLFESLEQFQRYYQARQLCDRLEEARSVDDSLMQVVLQQSAKVIERHRLMGTKPARSRYCEDSVYGRALGLLARLLGKAQRFDEEYSVIEKYLEQQGHKTMRAEFYSRKLLLELRQATQQREVAWLYRGLNTYFDAQDSLNEITQLDFGRKVEKLASALAAAKIEAPITIAQKRSKLQESVVEINKLCSADSGKTRWGDSNELATGVEEAALQHYAASNWEGGHFEGGLVATLFGLAVYDIIFADKTQFRCRFHTYPISLQTALDANAEQISARLALPNLPDHILNAFDELSSQAVQVMSINWTIPREALETVSKAMGPRLPLVLARLAANYRLYRGGFPDLTLWRVQDGVHECRIVEVKSTNDVLSDTQHFWLTFLDSCDIRTEICRVNAAGVKPRKGSKEEL